MNIYTELQDIATMIDVELYPETAACLHQLLVMDTLPSAYDIATDLREKDAAEELPDFLFDFYVALYKSAIGEGDAEAMNDLGALYYEGRGRAPDYKKAVCLYEMAALNGSRTAQENLGYCFYYGRNVAVDYEKAFHFFLMGALDGHLISLYKIGDMYQNGYYVQKNEIEAFRIYERCMQTMTEEAEREVAGPVFLRLGNCFLYGKGTDVNYETAMICFQKAEFYLYNMVKGGENMYRKSLDRAFAGQLEARKRLMEALR